MPFNPLLARPFPSVLSPCEAFAAFLARAALLSVPLPAWPGPLMSMLLSTDRCCRSKHRAGSRGNMLRQPRTIALRHPATDACSNC